MPFFHALVLILAQSDGGVSDKPTVLQLANGSYIFSPAAFKAVDGEMKRLQTELAEEKRRAKPAPTVKDENPPWLQVILVSAAVGLAVGVPAGFLLGRALPR